MTDSRIFDLEDRALRDFDASNKMQRKKRRYVRQHKLGVLVSGCKCAACFRLRASACKDVDTAISCDGSRSWDFVAATCRTCDTCHRIGFLPRESNWHRVYRCRGSDAVLAQYCYSRSCAWCQALIEEFLGRFHQ